MSDSLKEMRARLYSAVVCDALDQLGYTNQSPKVDFLPMTAHAETLVGRCKTTLWVDMAHDDPNPFELELKAVDECQPDDVFIAATGGSMRSAVWGELLTSAAMNGGCVGAVVDGAVRDVAKISDVGFPVFARGTRVHDSLNRQRVVDIDVVVEIAGVRFQPGDLVIADRDGVVVVPQQVENQALERAWQKVDGENKVRDAIQQGMKATDAYKKFGVL